MQLNALSFILASVPYDDVELPELELPPREVDASYSPPPREAWRRVPPVYTRDNLVVPTALRLRAASLMVLRDAEAVEAELDVPTPE